MTAIHGEQESLLHLRDCDGGGREREEMDGAGRALPQRGFKALQPCKTSTASSNVLSGRREA
jgi:hypothetical protein